jgi:hypothetical protein
MSGIDRRAATRAFRDRVVRRGVFALASASGRRWVGASRNLDVEESRLRFLLRQGLHRDRLLQQEWREHAEAAFRFEILDVLDETLPELAVAGELKAQTALRAAELGALVLLP